MRGSRALQYGGSVSDLGREDMSAGGGFAMVRCPTCGRRNRVPAAASGVPRCGACHTALPWITEANDQSFEAVAERSDVPVLVDLWAPWCVPCRMVSPAVERVATELAGRVKAVKVNVDASPAVAARFAAMSIPTLLILRDGAVVDRMVGAVPEHALLAWVSGRLGPATGEPLSA
jgi:thioredoxin 2